MSLIIFVKLIWLRQQFVLLSLLRQHLLWWNQRRFWLRLENLIAQKICFFCFWFKTKHFRFQSFIKRYPKIKGNNFFWKNSKLWILSHLCRSNAFQDYFDDAKDSSQESRVKQVSRIKELFNQSKFQESRLKWRFKRRLN